MRSLPSTFGKYFLTEKLATGGMAEIYLGKLIGPGGFEKQLVIKQIHPELSGRPRFVDLFVHEAKTLVGLGHGNIVPIYELGVVDDIYFIAMEYIDGPTLEALVDAHRRKQEAMAPQVAAYIAAEVLKGLDYAHRKGDGIVHRDLSPRNVLVSRDGEVKLLDFGIAIALGDRAPPAGDAGDGAPEGSFPYMSPEQVRRQALTGQSDLFSAGILLWEMLTGRRLFHRDSAEETLAAVERAEVPAPSTLRPQIPEALDEICRKALARDPAERYPSAGRALAAVSRFLYSVPEPTTPGQLSALVARYCPPSARRAETGETGDATPRSGADADRGIDRTVPMAGRNRARTETFATNVAFANILAKATPLFPLDAIRDPDDGEREAPSAQRPTRRRGWLALAAVIAIGAGAGALALARGDGQSNQRAAGTPDAGAARVGSINESGDGSDAAAADTAPIDAGIADAAPPDARRSRPLPRPARKDTVAPIATGILRVGANPWGEVYLDGRKLGRAPGQWNVPAGKHTVKVIFPVPGQQKERRFPAVVIAPGKVEFLGTVDFSSDR